MDNHDIAIGNFRSTHGEALTTASHPEHALRTAELTRFYEAKFGGGEEQAVVAGSPSPVSPVPTSDAVGGDRPGDDLARLVEPARQPSDYDFSKLQAPFGVETEKNSELENWSREWLHAGEVSPAEGQALASVYAESMSWDADQIERMAEQTGRDLRLKYGADAPAAATAALKVAEEMPEMHIFLESNGLLNHPRVIDNLIKAAEKRGYFKRSA